MSVKKEDNKMSHEVYGTKKQTYKRLSELLTHICFEENEDHIDISDFIVKR